MQPKIFKATHDIQGGQGYLHRLSSIALSQSQILIYHFIESRQLEDEHSRQRSQPWC